MTCLSIAIAVTVLREAVPNRIDSARYHLHPSRPDGHCLARTLSRSSGADTVDRRRSQQARFRARMLTRNAVNRVCRCITTAMDCNGPAMYLLQSTAAHCCSSQ